MRRTPSRVSRAVLHVGLREAPGVIWASAPGSFFSGRAVNLAACKTLANGRTPSGRGRPATPRTTRGTRDSSAHRSASQPDRGIDLIEACCLLQAQNKRCVPIPCNPRSRGCPGSTGTGSALPRKHGCPGHRDTKSFHSHKSGARMRCGCARAASDPGSRRGAGAERTAAQTRPPTRTRPPGRRRDDNGAATTAAPARRHRQPSVS